VAIVSNNDVILIKSAASGLTADTSDLLPVYLLRFDRKETRRAYRNDLRQFFRTDTVSLDHARSISFVDVNEHIGRLEDAGARASTIQRRVASLRGFFEWLIALKLLQANPAHRSVVRRVRRVSMKDRPITVLTVEQARRLLDATVEAGEAAIRDHAMLSVMLHCVLRRSEVSGMNIEHMRRVGEHWALDLPATKGGADQFVKIPLHIKEGLDAMCEHYGIADGALWRSLSRNSSRGHRLSPGGVYRVVKKTAERAALTVEIGAHTLRHTGCTLAIEAGASIQQVQAHARHKNVETTMTYVHQRDKLARSAADNIRI
jgi:site-specific recombinase XerD